MARAIAADLTWRRGKHLRYGFTTTRSTCPGLLSVGLLSTVATGKAARSTRRLFGWRPYAVTVVTLLLLFQRKSFDLLSIQQFIFAQQVQQIFLVIKIVHNSCLQGDLSA